MWLFIALIATPIVEIALFIEVGGLIGLWPTILIVIATAAIGAAMLRRQGFRTLAALETELRRGGDPSPMIAHGAMLVFAGALLLTPGFFTDAVGFALLVPSVRDALIAWAAPRIAGRVVRFGFGAGSEPPRRAGPDDAPIDAEYHEVSAPADPDARDRR